MKIEVSLPYEMSTFYVNSLLDVPDIVNESYERKKCIPFVLICEPKCRDLN